MSQKVLFVAGGSTGHTAPLLAVLTEVQRQAPELELHYAGSRADCTSPTVRDCTARFMRHIVPAGKLHRHATWAQLKESASFVAALVMVGVLLLRLRPSLLFLKGGAVSVPFALWAGLLRIPTYSHETDVAAGIANRIAAQVATTIFTAFPASFYPSIAKGKIQAVGQPVREIFYANHAQDAWRLPQIKRVASLPLVFITGGSQGALGLNLLVAEVWPQLLARTQVVQQVGSTNLSLLQIMADTLPPELRRNLCIVPILSGEEMVSCMQQASVVISRAGGTIFELAAVRAASILVPLPTAAQDHQRKNARALANEGAVVVVQQGEGAAAQLWQELQLLLDDDSERTALQDQIAQFDHPTAAAVIAAALVAATPAS